MSVERRELPSGAVTFLVRWREGDRARSKSFAAARFGGIEKARRAAQAYHAQVSDALITGGVAPSSVATLTVEELIRQWIPSAAPRLAPKTRVHYAHLLDAHVLPYLGDRPARALTPADVEDWAAELQRAGVGAATIRKAGAVLSAVMQRAVKSRDITTNPVRDATLPAAPRQREPVFITPVEVERIRAHMLEHGRTGDALLVSLLAYSGLRPESEAWPLRWSDVGEHTIHVPANRKRGARDRAVDLLPPLAADLAEWRPLCKSSRVVPFTGGHVGGDGEWTDQAWRNWRRRTWLPAVQASGVREDARPRDLRGSFVSLLIYEGRNVVEIAQMLGHAPSMTLNTYARTFSAHKRRNIVSATTAIRRARAEVTGLRVVG